MNGSGPADESLALEDADDLTTLQITRIIKRMKGVLQKADKFGDPEMKTVITMWKKRLSLLRTATENGEVVSNSTCLISSIHRCH